MSSTQRQYFLTGCSFCVPWPPPEPFYIACQPEHCTLLPARPSYCRCSWWVHNGQTHQNPLSSSSYVQFACTICLRLSPGSSHSSEENLRMGDERLTCCKRDLLFIWYEILYRDKFLQFAFFRLLKTTKILPTLNGEASL